MRRKQLFSMLFFGLLLWKCSADRAPDVGDRTLTPPQNFKSVILGPDSVKLSWKNPSFDRFQYVKIFRSLTDHPLLPDNGDLEVYKGNLENFTDSGLNPGQRYYYSIFAFRSGSEYSAKASSNAMPYDLSMPRNLKGQRKIDALLLSWEAPLDINYNGVRILRKLKADGFSSSPTDGVMIQETETPFFEDTPALGKGFDCHESYNYSLFAYSEAEGYKSFALQPAKLESIKAYCADEIPVNVTITKPEPGSFFNFSVLIEAVASIEAPFSISKVEFQIDGVKIGEDLTAPYQITWNPPLPTDKSVEIKAVAHTSAGLSCEAKISVVVDQTPPTVDITAPLDGSLKSDNIKLSGEIQDLHPAYLEFYLNNQLKVRDTSTPYTYYWQTRTQWNPNAEPAEGDQDFKIIAYDKAGNKAEKTITFEVNNPPYITTYNPLKTPGSITNNVPFSKKFFSVTFSEPMDGATINSTSFFLQRENTLLPTLVSYDNTLQQALLSLADGVSLEKETIYTLTAAKDITDLGSTPMNLGGDQIWSFKTSACQSVFDETKFGECFFE